MVRRSAQLACGSSNFLVGAMYGVGEGLTSKTITKARRAVQVFQYFTPLTME